MTEYELTQVQAQPYLYAEGESSMDPDEIGAAMGQTFQKVYSHMQAHGIEPQGAALSVYYGYDPEVMRFRAGFPVQSDAAEHASSDVQYDETPSGQVLHFKHVGPYDKLRDAYGGLLQYAEAQGVKVGAPGWEFYLNDPATTAPEALVTEAYVAIE